MNLVFYRTSTEYILVVLLYSENVSFCALLLLFPIEDHHWQQANEIYCLVVINVTRLSNKDTPQNVTRQQQSARQDISNFQLDLYFRKQKYLNVEAVTTTG